jgi:hypothetical protein
MKVGRQRKDRRKERRKEGHGTLHK